MTRSSTTESRTFEDRQRDVAALREAFDEAFRAPAAGVRGASTPLLRIGAGEGEYLVPLASLAGLRRLEALVPLAGERTGFLGLAGDRGRVVAVFDLGVLLGHAASSRVLPWLLLAETPSGLAGLAFERFGGQLAAAVASVRSFEPPDRPHPAVSGLVPDGDRSRFLVDVGALLGAAGAPDSRPPGGS